MKIAAGLLALAFLIPRTYAQDNLPPAPPVLPTPGGPALPTPAPASPIIPALTPVSIEIMTTINSAANKIGEHFPIKLAAPIPLADGREVPAGIMGSGDVVHAAKSRFGGKAGELILAVRYLDWNGVRIPLRSLTYTRPEHGRDNTGAATATAIVISPVLALFITGGEVNIPAGTIAFAKTSAAVTEAPPSTSVESSQPTQGASTIPATTTQEGT